MPPVDASRTEETCRLDVQLTATTHFLVVLGTAGVRGCIRLLEEMKPYSPVRDLSALGGGRWRQRIAFRQTHVSRIIGRDD